MKQLFLTLLINIIAFAGISQSEWMITNTKGTSDNIKSFV